MLKTGTSWSAEQAYLFSLSVLENESTFEKTLSTHSTPVTLWRVRYTSSQRDPNTPHMTQCVHLLHAPFRIRPRLTLNHFSPFKDSPNVVKHDPLHSLQFTGHMGQLGPRAVLTVALLNLLNLSAWGGGGGGAGEGGGQGSSDISTLSMKFIGNRSRKPTSVSTCTV